MKANPWRISLFLVVLILFQTVGCTLVLEEDGDQEEALYIYSINLRRAQRFSSLTPGVPRGSLVNGNMWADLSCKRSDNKPVKDEDCKAALPWRFAGEGDLFIEDEKSEITLFGLRLPLRGSEPLDCSVFGAFGSVSLITLGEMNVPVQVVTVNNRITISSPRSNSRIEGGSFEMPIICRR